MTTDQTYINIFLSDRLISLSRGENGTSVLLQDTDSPDTINLQPFAMAYTMDDRWLYGADATRYAKRYPERAILSLAVLLGEEREIHLAGKTFLAVALLVYYFQEIDRKVRQYLDQAAIKYTLTLPNGITLFQRSTVCKAMQMASMEMGRIHRYTDHISLYLEYTLKPETDPYCLCIFIDRYSCGLGLYELGNGVTESVATEETSTVSDASLIPYLASNLVRKYTESGKDATHLNYPKLVTECERILATPDVSGVRGVYFSEVGTSEIEHLLRIEAAEIYSWITAHLDKVLHSIDKMLVDAGRADSPDEIWIDAEGIDYTTFAFVLAKKFGKPIRAANGAARKGAAVFHGVLTGEVRDVLFLGSLSHDIGVLLKDGSLVSLIAKNKTIPTKRSEMFCISTNQNHIEIPIFADGRFIGGQLLPIGTVPADEPVNIEVTIDVDANTNIQVSSKIKGDLSTERTLSLPTEYAMEKNFKDTTIFTSELTNDQ